MYKITRFDYGFAAMAAMFWGRNKRAAIGAAMCAGAVTATALLTNYPGGVKRVISFHTHGRIDAEGSWCSW